ncbi:uncharacterized protein LOC143255963 [Tachypleus tridentatus]|uniref:uncharacterized protein LOC143255963 n=1 Tax=Tachypleus tridentatus TaxID=6853 RepID=UPI003FD695F2
MESSKEVDILIIGSGPTGLGAATRLHQLNHENWLMIDALDKPGGLASTDVTPEGFLFDIGGHVIFSHYKYFDDLLDHALGTGSENWAFHERICYVYTKGRYIPYPFQNNISQLNVEDQIECITGLIQAQLESATACEKPETFDEWIIRVMGKGIANIFMRPYNFKVWATPTTLMQCKWLGERVATVDVNRVIKNVLLKKAEVGWGPNATFRFPQHGGTGAIWNAVANLLPKSKMKFSSKVIALNLDKKEVRLDSGDSLRYNKLLSTMPLDYTLKLVEKPELANKLKHSKTHIIGIGLRGHQPRMDASWIYYPEDNCPFYRATIFSSLGKTNTPPADCLLPTIQVGITPVNNKILAPGPYRSIMVEVSESEHKPVNKDTIVHDGILGAINVGLMESEDEIVSIHYRKENHGYPIPHIDRDGVLEVALPWLKEHSVWSRGRFGSYKYEIGNQDHSLMIGVEAVNNMLYGEEEVTLCRPDYVNKGSVKNKIIYEPKIKQE